MQIWCIFLAFLINFVSIFQVYWRVYFSIMSESFPIIRINKWKPKLLHLREKQLCKCTVIECMPRVYVHLTKVM